MDITRIAINNRQTTTFLLLCVFIAGIASYQAMPRAQDPGFIIRAAQVVTYFPGASPGRVEQLVTDKLEKAIQEIPELDFVNSESRTGVSIITVNIKESYSELRPIWDKLRRKVDSVRDELPDSTSDPEVNDEFGDVFGLVYAITSDGFNYAELKEVADSVRDELLLLEDVAKVEIWGAQEERIFVEYRNSRLVELGISPTQLANILTSRNIINPGGDIDTGFERIALEPTGNFESVTELKMSLIEIPHSKEVIALGDIADIYRGYIDPPSSMMTFNGDTGLALAISMREEGDIIDLGRKVRKVMAKLQNEYPIGIEFGEIAFEGDVVLEKVDSFMVNLIQAVVIVSLVMLVFLGLRTGFIVASLVPGAILASMFVMDVFEIGIDQVSLAALMIALGMLVDNAIVMSENIMVQIEHGKKVITAAIDSATELRVPLLTSSLTTSAAFLPIILAESSMGEYSAPLFKVVTITLLCSWVLAITMIPLLCVLFMRRKLKTSTEDEHDNWFYNGYRAALRWMMTHRWSSIALVVIAFYWAMVGFGHVPKIFLPPKEDALFTIDVEMPMGSPIHRTRQITQSISGFIEDELAVNDQQTEGAVSWASFVGNAGPRFVLSHDGKPATDEYSFTIVNTTSHTINDELMAKVDDYVFNNFPEVQLTLKKLKNGQPVKYPVAFRVSGRDLDQVDRIAKELKAHLSTIPGTKNLGDDWGLLRKKLVVKVDAARAQRAGVTNADVATSLRTAFKGIDLTEFREDGSVIPITLRSVNAGSHQIIASETLNVFTQNGNTVPLSQVAEAELVFEPGKVLRRNRLKTKQVYAFTEPDANAIEIMQQMEPWLEKRKKEWPAGYRVEFGGEAETSGKANSAIMDKLPIAGLIIVLLLMTQFNCFRSTLIVILIIPLALIGVSIGLLSTGAAFGFMSFLGVISLAGIVINNAIVLIDRIRIENEENEHTLWDAILIAAEQRLRPILLTTATTALGLLPLWFGGGAMWETMAITIIFGLLGATILTLGVVPVLYSLFFRVKPNEAVATS